jgi:hypothetical protein
VRTRLSRGVIWFNRLLLVAATYVMTMIAFRNLRDPIAAALPVGIVLSSPTAITVARVGFGGFPLGIAIALAGCLVATPRLLTGASVLAAVIGAATVARVQGLLVDGATSYNVKLLRPEIVFFTLSLVAIALERRRRQGS